VRTKASARSVAYVFAEFAQRAVIAGVRLKREWLSAMKVDPHPACEHADLFLLGGGFSLAGEGLSNIAVSIRSPFPPRDLREAQHA